MKKAYSCDLHIHSCLSPCGDDDMTPANIAGLASLLELNIVALTDHNSTKNCPAFFAHAKRYGIVPVAGCELTTAEEIHVICLFETLEDALRFGEEIHSHIIPVKNRPEIFGNQYVMNEDDEVCREEEVLLITATDLDIEASWELCAKFGGICYPAHIDRESGGMAAVLGTIPTEPNYSAFELNHAECYEEYMKRFPHLKEKRYVVSSDAHTLTSMSDGAFKIELDEIGDDEPSYSAAVRRELFKFLRGE